MIVTRRMEQIQNGEKPKEKERVYLKARLRDLYTEFLDNQKFISALRKEYNTEDKIIKYLKFE